MNYLAHFHLAGSEPGWLVGGLLGDYVKGPLTGSRPRTIEQGILLHRRIDHFTASQPMAAAIARRLPGEFRRFAGILQDLVYDHFLGNRWHQFDARALPEYTAGIYACLHRHRHWLTPAAERFSQRLQQHDLLCRYADWATVEASLASIGQRLRRANPLHLAGPRLANHLPELESVFMDSYPAVVEYARRQRRMLAADHSSHPTEATI